MATKEQQEILNKRADQLEAIGFVMSVDKDNVWYEKGPVKMAPTLMMCAPTKQWNDFIEKNTTDEKG